MNMVHLITLELHVVLPLILWKACSSGRILVFLKLNYLNFSDTGRLKARYRL